MSVRREQGVGKSATPTKPSLHVVPADGAQITIQIRPLRRTADEGVVVMGASPLEALEKALAADVTAMDEPVMTWPADVREALVALDFDRPESHVGLTDEDVATFFPVTLPQPAAAWVTHGGGLRVIFAATNDATALELAGAWLMFAPLAKLAGWKLEVKTDTRHPEGLRDGLPCGRVHRFTPLATLVVPKGTGSVTAEQVEVWLSERGLTRGRHPATACPWAPKVTNGNPPVLIDETGVQCFHCRRFAPWSEILGGDNARLPSAYEAARAIVHYGHQRHVIGALYPHVPKELAQPAWSLILRTVNQDRLTAGDDADREGWEARIDTASSPALDIARSSSGAWLDSTTLVPRRVSNDLTLKFLPSAFWPPMIDKAASAGPLDGFAPLHPVGATEVVGPFVEPPRGTLFVARRRQPDDPPPVDTSRRPTAQELENAWALVGGVLPGVSRGYLSGLITAAFVGQRGVGTWPILCVTGQTGSAKTAQIALAAGMVGVKATAIALGNNDDARRMAGLALEEGARLLFADEVGRVSDVFSKLQSVLEANSTLRFRAKYANEREVPVRAGLVLLGSTLPSAIVASPEVARRSVGYRLTGAEKKWKLVDPRTDALLDLSECRRVDALRAALDTITCAVWWDVADLGPSGDWRALLLDKYEAVELGDLDLVSDREARTDAIRALYEYFRTAGTKDLSAMDGWKGWLIADPGSDAGTKVQALIDVDADKTIIHAQVSDLERQNLAPVLGFDSPQLQLLVRPRGKHLLVKFVEVGKRKGTGTPREKLPPVAPTTATPSDTEVVL